MRSSFSSPKIYQYRLSVLSRMSTTDRSLSCSYESIVDCFIHSVGSGSSRFRRRGEIVGELEPLLRLQTTIVFMQTTSRQQSCRAQRERKKELSRVESSFVKALAKEQVS